MSYLKADFILLCKLGELLEAIGSENPLLYRKNGPHILELVRAGKEKNILSSPVHWAIIGRGISGQVLGWMDGAVGAVACGLTNRNP